MTWLLGTKIGRTTLATLAVCLVVWLSWLGFSAHYYNAGVAACQLGLATDTNAANVAQGEKNIDNNLISGRIGKESASQRNELLDAVETDRNNSKESITDVYKAPPATAPVALGSCVHPVDRRVQDRLEAARAAAVGARSP